MYAGGDERFNAMTAVLKLTAVCAEGIRVNDISPCLYILAVDGLNQFRLRQVKRLGHFSKFGAAGLQHGAHGAVQQDDFIQ